MSKTVDEVLKRASEPHQPEALPRQSIDLAQSIFDKIEELGDGAPAHFKATPTMVKKWQSGTAEPGVTACQIMLDEILALGGIDMDGPAFQQPPEQGETRPEAAPVHEAGRKTTETDGNESERLTLIEPEKIMKGTRKVSFLTPINRDMSYAVVLSMLGNWKATLPVEIRGLLGVMDFEPDTTPHFSRNRLASRFLESGNEWSIWIDSDIIAPIGNAPWFKRRTGAKHADHWFARSAYEALTSRGKTLIGAVYSERASGGKIITQPGLAPRTELDKQIIEDIKSGPKDKVVQVGWLGFGFVAVHRQVYVDILATQEGVKSEDFGQSNGKPHNFFTPMNDGGPQSEDVAFCKRAAAAGHPSFLDLAVFCGHVGKFAYMP